MSLKFTKQKSKGSLFNTIDAAIFFAELAAKQFNDFCDEELFEALYEDAKEGLFIAVVRQHNLLTSRDDRQSLNLYVVR